MADGFEVGGRECLPHTPDDMAATTVAAAEREHLEGVGKKRRTAADGSGTDGGKEVAECVGGKEDLPHVLVDMAAAAETAECEYAEGAGTRCRTPAGGSCVGAVAAAGRTGVDAGDIEGFAHMHVVEEGSAAMSVRSVSEILLYF